MRTPLSPTRLHALIVQSVVQGIVAGRIPPGESLPAEPELAGQYGVSRAVVREAVRVLVEKGLVEVRQGRGSRVNPPEQWNQMDPVILLARLRTGQMGDILHELMEVRQMLEVECAGLAARRIPAAGVDDLSALLDRMAAHLDDARQYTEYDNRFHQRIAEAARNRLLLGLIQPLAEVFGMARHMSAALSGQLRPSFAEHREILAALAAHDEAGARSAMLRHVVNHEATLRDALRAGLPDYLRADETGMFSTREVGS